MNSELRALYQEVIVDHGRHPRNFGAMAEATHVLEGYNPLCGDQLKLFLLIKDNKIEKAMFEGTGCAISMASASLMSQHLQGKSLEETKQLFQHFHAMVVDKQSPDEHLGKLTILEGVKEYPARVKCATLAWHTLHNLLEGKNEVAVTE
ncbi:MAG: SUF system NifU family Fe-S cluster assembly protein [Pseudomonadota bacterium]